MIHEIVGVNIIKYISEFNLVLLLVREKLRSENILYFFICN